MNKNYQGLIGKGGNSPLYHLNKNIIKFIQMNELRGHKQTNLVDYTDIKGKWKRSPLLLSGVGKTATVMREIVKSVFGQ